MTGRLLMTTAVLSIAALAISCGDDDDAGNPDEQQIISVSQNAVYAWIDAGADGLDDYLSDSAIVTCPPASLQESLDDYGTPGNWIETRDIEFEGDSDATATVVIDANDDEKPEQWTFVREDNSWRIATIAGVIPCKVPAV